MSTEREQLLAGELSTVAPLSSMHPEDAIPLARYLIERDHVDHAHLGLATTRELINELRARIETDYVHGGGGLDYTTVGGRP